MSLVLDNISKSFYINNTKEKKVLQGIIFNINNGDLIAIRGKSGAGKSTLMHILGLLDYPTDGKYMVDDVDIFKKSDKYLAEIRNEKFGFVLQDFGLIEGETVFNNVAVPLLLGKCKLREIRGIVESQLEKLGIIELMDTNVSLLSGGEKQRVAIARAMVNKPEYIFADEPTGSLDGPNAQNVMDILKKINKEGCTVIVITHDEQIAEQCRKIIYIEDGKLIS